jgi:hypothetical protein
MDRVYTNHRPGERRIHIEVDEHEIPALIADLTASGLAQSDETRNLLAVLEQSRTVFGTGRR